MSQPDSSPLTADSTPDARPVSSSGDADASAEIPPYDAGKLGAALAGARLRAKMTLDQLALKSGVSRRMIVDIERGHKGCTLRTLHALAHAVGVPLSVLADAGCGHDPE
ncbi:helix-turn-helix transcriptional regulator [Actinoplanes sp. NPDC024001]|uniref:helix-turn-helix domain-containing protein n=1 Tax=Actinoplanes sp. NPDC024001 TaxID=3154598 RepID=UPI0033FC84FF